MRLLESLHFDKLMHPWFLLLWIAVAALLAAECFKRAPGALTISTGDSLSRIRGRGRTLLHHTPAFLRALGLVLLIVALARPLTGLRPRVERVDIVDIMLCVDVSGSMRAMDFVARGEPRDRLYVTKMAVRDFIASRKVRSDDRFGIDRLGLILYAGYAWTQTPLTLDYGILERDLDAAHIDERNREKSGTAIGSAIGLAVSRLIKSEAESKVVILLTDGRNNTGELDPITAAQIAKDYDIRIYTIGAGSTGDVLVPQRDMLGRVRYRQENVPIDEDTLRKIADVTGAKFYRATDTEALEGAYAEINELETTEIEVGDYYDHEEGFVPWALMGAAAVSLSVFTRRMWFDPIP